MQFIAHGPEIPEALLQAHEEGRVVFFCGAGISYPAALPGFKGLVDQICRRVGTQLTPIESEAYSQSKFDAVLDLLERRLPGQRLAVRKELSEILKPRLRRKGAQATHAALLELARTREGAVRLVTTNFDRIFEHVLKRNRKKTGIYTAPMLPIPKNSRWDGIVYLHGLLPGEPDESALHRLVLSSGDFGLAYLVERWAARFVSELFRHYVVCFVGYSINDPVLRYMMDALAADQMQGEVIPPAYALGECQEGEEEAKTIEWKLKNVIPILYDPKSDHSSLHKTIQAWAETWRDGTLGKERIVSDYAIARPSASTKQDDFVGRMLWALSHESGLPARRFADFNPVPALEWLEAFTESRYGHSDLSRFAVPPLARVDKKLNFSLIQRPVPYTLAPLMSLVSWGPAYSQWDEVMFNLARWLVRHLNDPKLMLWLVQRGAHLNERFAWLIERELDRIATFEREGKAADLAALQANAPNAIPRDLMRILWRILLTGRVKTRSNNLEFYRWRERFKRDGLTPSVRVDLREVFAPKVVLRPSIRWNEGVDPRESSERGEQNITWEIELNSDHVHSTLQGMDEKEWGDSLPYLLPEFEILLRDALDLSRELGGASDLRDQSHYDMPSIAAHWQNRGFRDWVALIELLRDSWLALRAKAPTLATQRALRWFDEPYPTFKRIALFAASQDGCIGPDQWVDWLECDKGWWLWWVGTQREVMRLLVLQGKNLTLEARSRIESAILSGPPEGIIRSDGDQDEAERAVAYMVWVRLAKLRSTGISMGEAAAERLATLSEQHPEWRLAANERDEFAFWMSGSDDPDFEEIGTLDRAPRSRSGLIQWLRHPGEKQSVFDRDDWSEICRTRFAVSMYALCSLGREGVWPVSRWRDALQAWSEGRYVKRSWRFAAPVLQSIPDDKLLEISPAFTWWLEAVSKSISDHEAAFLYLCSRILRLSYEDRSDYDDPVTHAINHPVGRATQALLSYWFKTAPGDNDGLPISVEEQFTKICNINDKILRHGRVLLGTALIGLFRVDRRWVEVHLLPIFDWDKNSSEAKGVWEGFLWSPRIYKPLLQYLKPYLLGAARHYADLGSHSRQFTIFLTFATLDSGDGDSLDDFRSAVSALPQEGLAEAAQALVQALESAGEQREDYWKNRIFPYWKNMWPKTGSLASQSIAESVARLSIAAGREFPEALGAVKDWLVPIEYPNYIVSRVYELGLCREHPDQVLQLLARIIDQQSWLPEELGQCLDAIRHAAPSLVQSAEFVNLLEYARRRQN